MFKGIDFTLFTYLAYCALVMAANTILGIAKAYKKEDFNWDTLKKGIIKYLLILLAVCLIFVGGLLLPEFKIEITEIGRSYTTIDALLLIAMAVAGKYLVSCIKNILELFGLKIEDVFKTNKTIADVQNDEYLG